MIPAGHLFERIGIKELRGRTAGGKLRQQRQARSGHDLIPCPGCKGDVQLKVQKPAEPTMEQRQAAARLKLQSTVASVQAPDATPHNPHDLVKGSWAYGVTTVPQRKSSGELLLTLASLRAAGFDKPTLFVDGPDDDEWFKFGIDFAFRGERIGAVGNWLLTAWELLIRNPQAERFAIFQDDFIAVKNLKAYLDAVPWPANAWLNLYTFSKNEAAVHGKRGWVETDTFDVSPEGHRWQWGLGAVALCFERAALEACVSSSHWIRKIADCREHNPSVGDFRQKRLRGIDGGVQSALNLAGYREYVHAPSLVQHVGHDSSMGNGRHKQALTFPGDQFDAMSWLK